MRCYLIFSISLNQALAISIATGIALISTSSVQGEDISDAAAHAKVNELRIFFSQGTSINHKDQYGLTLLMHACRRGQLETVRSLLSKGADPNITDRQSLFGPNALRTAIFFGHGRIAKLLIDEGANAEGITPLMLAAIQNKPKTIQQLLAQGDNLWAVDKYLTSALDHALKLGKSDSVSALLHGQERFSYYSQMTVAAMKGDAKLVVALIRKGVDVDEGIDPVGHFSETALMYASRLGHVQIVEVLVKAGADANANNHVYGTGLMQAAKYGHIEVMKVLLENGAEIDKRSREKTPLMIAVISNQSEVVKYLLQNGANKSITRSDGTNAMHLAKKLGHEEIMRVLSKSSLKKHQCHRIRFRPFKRVR